MARPVRFFMLDVSATVPLLLLLLFPSWTLFWGTIGFGLLLSWMRRNGWTGPMLARFLATLAQGPRVAAGVRKRDNPPEVPY